MTITTSSSITKTYSSFCSAFSIKVQGSGIPSVNQEYKWRPHTTIPKGFASVCSKNQWDIQSTWDTLNEQRMWLHSVENDAYIYLNSMDGHWWIDEPNGNGVYVAPRKCNDDSFDGNSNDLFLPPISGWRSLGGVDYEPLPNVEIIVNDEK